MDFFNASSVSFSMGGSEGISEISTLLAETLGDEWRCLSISHVLIAFRDLLRSK